MKKLTKKEILRNICITILTIIFLVVISMIINPIRRTNSGIHRYLLRIIPIGTSMEDVIRVAEENDMWTIRYIRENFGVVLHSTSSTPTGGLPNPRFPIVGDQHIRVHLGTYNIIIRVDVEAFFAFNENGELIEIFVRKFRDLL